MNRYPDTGHREFPRSVREDDYTIRTRPQARYRSDSPCKCSGPRGLVAPLIDGGLVKGDKGQFIFSYDAYGFADGEAPDTVNPSLWRQATLMGKGGGLFKLADRLYQVIGQDLSNTTIIEGDTGATAC